MGDSFASRRLRSKMNCLHLKLVLCTLLAVICFNQVTCGLTPSSTTLAPECGANSGETLIGKNDVSYRGCQTQTRSGYECQKWESQNPHTHKYTPEAYPDSGLVKNYCRNPSGSGTIWCYTTDPNKRWEYCDPLGAEWRDVVANEAQLTNTCTGTCDSVGILDHDPNWLKKNCKVVKDANLCLLVTIKDSFVVIIVNVGVRTVERQSLQLLKLSQRNKLLRLNWEPVPTHVMTTLDLLKQNSWAVMNLEIVINHEVVGCEDLLSVIIVFAHVLIISLLIHTRW